MKALIVLTFSLLFPSLVLAANYQNGSELHRQNCSGCHDTAVYTRENRRVTSLDKLGTQVRFCRDNLGITWFDDQVNDVIFFLNKDFYQFK